jgi:hypothetical protein
MCPNHRADKSMFCGVECANVAQRKSERKIITCEQCSTKFETLQDHGEWPKFCSRQCFLDRCIRPEEKECESCGGLFLAIRSSTTTRGDGRRLFCSKKCSIEGGKTGEERNCAHCGIVFYTSPSHDHLTCSFKCRSVYFSGVNSGAFKRGFYVNNQSNSKMILFPRETHKGKYLAEHRIIASQTIGRLLTRDEFVIHINNNKLDNKPSNLFICESNSTYSKIRCGSLPWPKKSNLKTYEGVKND